MKRCLWLVLALTVAACGGDDGDGPAPGDSDGGDSSMGDGDTTHGDHDSGTDQDLPDGVELNQGFIGGACASANDCDNPNFNSAPVCEVPGEGFPNGMCTQSCSQGSNGNWVCPDEDTSGGTDFTVTRCIENDAGAPRCVSECNFEKSPTGCRPGYTCVLKKRYNTNSDERIYPVCLPSDVQRWPGQPAPTADIGAACEASVECGHLACLRANAGYCTKYLCELSGCPSGSSCVQFGDGANAFTACLKDCDNDSQCRQADSYACKNVGGGLCWLEPPQHDPSVGQADCAAAWGSAGELLHPCDQTKDNYIVINKGARNLALCNAGALVWNANTGLGFRPTGDKEREGDGKTPEGVLYIARLVPNSEFDKAFLFSYPDKGDAERGLAASMITADQKAAIDAAIDSCGEPPQTTALGSLIEVHGGHVQDAGDWTNGCVAVTDVQVNDLWGIVGLRDTIVVKP